MDNNIFSSWPFFTDEEFSAVTEVLRSNKVNYWTGTVARAFETEFASWIGTNHAVALANGTVALDTALNVLDIGFGDEVIVTSRTFFASVSSIVNAGAIPVFADVDVENGNITAKTISHVITSNTRAIVCVHLAGWPCDMDEIMVLAEQYNLFVIEDCAQAHGAKYKGRSVGSIGHIGCWSFCQDKIITTGGEGGMVTTNDRELWSKMWSYKDHGKSWDAVYERMHPPGFRWLHESFGTNCRMTEMQAAIGRIQLRRMKDWTSVRTANAMKIQQSLFLFAGEGGVVRVPKFCFSDVNGNLSPDESVHAYYKYYTYVQPENLAVGWSRDKIIHEINQLGVPCYSGSCSEVYLEKAFDGTSFRPVERLPVARKLGETTLMFLVHPTLTDHEIEKTCSVVRTVLGNASNMKS